MKYDSMLYLKEQLSITRDKSHNKNLCSIENYINYLKEVIGYFYIDPGNINIREGGYDFVFTPSKNSCNYYIKHVLCKAFSSDYIIYARINEHKRIKIVNDTNGFSLSIYYSNNYASDEGIYFLSNSKNSLENEFKVAYYDSETSNTLRDAYNISPELLEYTPNDLYKLGLEPDEESRISFKDSGLLNEEVFEQNNVGDIYSIITNNILNKVNLWSIVYKCNESFRKGKQL